MSLLIPQHHYDAVSVAAAVKAVLAAKLFAPTVKIAVNPDADAAYPILKIDDMLLVEANAMIRLLYGKPLTPAQETLFAAEQTELYWSAKDGQKLSAEQCQAWLDRVQHSTAVSPENVAVFGALQGLVTALGKAALSQEMQLLMWYQKFSGNPQVQKALKAELNGLKVVKRPTKSTKTPSKAKDAAALAAAAEPSLLPENTGVQKVLSHVAVRDLGPEIRPKAGERNVLVTSALPYVNNVPHLGNVVGSVMSADIYARYAKGRNYNTLFICGTDEYGTATETKALEDGVTPLELCTKYHKVHKEVYDWFQIGFDYFGRTSTQQQTEIAQEIFLDVLGNQFMEEQTREQLYCTQHNGFLADRFVEGTCPKCGSAGARGDQCDTCGNLLNPMELIDPRCKIDGHTPEIRETSHLYINLDKLEPEINEWVAKSTAEGRWSKNAVAITNNWLKEGLKPRAITRDLKWGVPVPLEAFKDKVLYVWFDACIGYVSITANYSPNHWKEWWHSPETVELTQFMGKDNVPFHSVVFPGTQIGTRNRWTKVNNLSATEYLQYEGGKFSKSKGYGVFGNNAKDVGVPPSVWRYYLACNRPESGDTQFSWTDFVARNNNELLANLGNFVNRVVKFVLAKYNGVVPQANVAEALGHEYYQGFVADINKLLASYVDNMEDMKLRAGLEAAMSISARGNQFLQENKLDNSLFAETPERSHAVVTVGLGLIYLLSAILTPFMPETGKDILEQLNAPARAIPDEFDLALLPGHCIGKAQYLFKRIDEAKADEWRATYSGKQVVV